MTTVVVVGAGIIGVTTALSILEKDPTIKVTVVAAKFSPNTTSDGAAGLIVPHCMSETPIELLRKWTSKTLKTLQTLSYSEQSPQLGIFLTAGFDVWADKVDEDPPLDDFVLFHRRMTEKELADYPAQPARYGVYFTTFVAEGKLLIPCLMNKVKELGGTFVKRCITSLSELSDYDVIVNCTGFGARELVGDLMVKPIRGQVMRIKAPWIKCSYGYIFEDENQQMQASYLIPQIDSVVVGGTFERDNCSTKPTSEDTEKIISGASRISPSIKNAPVLQNWAGLRPGRNCVRLERETIKYTDQQGHENELNVVHNYGHGGGGITLSFGCADECSELVLKELANKRKSKV